MDPQLVAKLEARRAKAEARAADAIQALLPPPIPPAPLVATTVVPPPIPPPISASDQLMKDGGGVILSAETDTPPGDRPIVMPPPIPPLSPTGDVIPAGRREPVHAPTTIENRFAAI